MSIPLPIGRASALTGVPTWRIREWEARGLVTPQRKPSGHRVFGETELHRLRELNQALVGAPDAPVGARVAVEPVMPAPQPAPVESEGLPVRGRNASLGEAAIRLTRASGEFDDLKSLLEYAMDTVLELTRSRFGAISYADLTKQQYVLAAHRGLSLGYVKGIESWQLDEGLAGRAYSLREPVFIDDLSEVEIVPRSIVHEEGLRSYICVPILRGGRRLGIVEVFSKSRDAFVPEDVAAVEMVSGAVATAVENSRLADELEFFRMQRDNLSRHWMAQLGRAVEDFQGKATSTIAGLIDEIESEPSMGRAEILRELRGVSSGLTNSRLMAANLHDTVSAYLTEGGVYLRGRLLSLEMSECDVNVDHVFAGRVLELIESLISQVSHSATECVSVKVELRDTLVVEICDDVKRAQRTDFVASLSSACLRLIRTLDAKVRSPLAGTGPSAIWVSIPFKEADHALNTLTPKERDVLRLLSRGSTNRELAHELFISPKTLQNHLTAIYRKLDVQNRTEAIALMSSMP